MQVFYLCCNWGASGFNIWFDGVFVPITSLSKSFLMIGIGTFAAHKDRQYLQTTFYKIIITVVNVKRNESYLTFNYINFFTFDYLYLCPCRISQIHMIDKTRDILVIGRPPEMLSITIYQNFIASL